MWHEKWCKCTAMIRRPPQVPYFTDIADACPLVNPGFRHRLYSWLLLHCSMPEALNSWGLVRCHLWGLAFVWCMREWNSIFSWCWNMLVWKLISIQNKDKGTMRYQIWAIAEQRYVCMINKYAFERWMVIKGSYWMRHNDFIQTSVQHEWVSQKMYSYWSGDLHPIQQLLFPVTKQ